MKINELFKHRSVTSCMNEAYNLMTDNFKDLLKHTWMAVLPYAFLTALFVYLRTPNKPLHDWGEANPMLSFFFQSVVYVCLIVTALFMGAIIWKWITDKAFSHCLKRYTLVSVCSFAFIMIGGIIISLIVMALGAVSGLSFSSLGSGSVNSLGIAVLCSFMLIILIILLLLPLAYIFPRYMLLEKGEKMKVWKSFKTGFRHCGAIFKMGFLGVLLIMVCNIILSIPMSIMTGAQIFSQLGALDGDPVGVPGYFAPLYIIVSTLALFIFDYIYNWLLISFIYLYGSIESDEKEKAEMQQMESASKLNEIIKE